MIMNAPALMLVSGKRHFRRSSSLSVNDQPSRLKELLLMFWISIQSGYWPVSSRNVRVLLDMNSVMITGLAANPATDDRWRQHDAKTANDSRFIRRLVRIRDEFVTNLTEKEH